MMTSKTPNWMPELFFCHRYEFAFIADMMGFRLGTRSDQFNTNRTHKLFDDDIPVDFVDNNFKNPDRDRLEDIVSKTDSEFVVLPDVYDEGDLTSVVEYGQRLESEYQTTPIVVPKDELEYQHIPDHWILGFSVPSGYGETEVSPTEFTSHRVHLLGGSPRNQIKYANKLTDCGAELYSVDGNAFAKAASYGNIINEPVEIMDDSGGLDQKAWVADADGYTDWGQRIAQSLARYYELWRQWSLKKSSEYSVEDVAANT